MGDLQHFCLRWNNYQSSITSAFENLRDDEDFVDVTLACDGKSLKAHRVVLSACSPYFRELLKSTPCKHPVIVLQDVIFEDLHALVEFIYHGEVNVHQKALPSFLKTAEVLRVSGLTQQSEVREEATEKAGFRDSTNAGEDNWLAYRRTPTTPSHRHRERRPSASDNTDNQVNLTEICRKTNKHPLPQAQRATALGLRQYRQPEKKQPPPPTQHPPHKNNQVNLTEICRKTNKTTPSHRHRERRPSASDNTDNQVNLTEICRKTNKHPLPQAQRATALGLRQYRQPGKSIFGIPKFSVMESNVKKIKTETNSELQAPQPSSNHQEKEESEPPMDFSTSNPAKAARKNDSSEASPGRERDREREKEGREEREGHSHAPVKSEPAEGGGGGGGEADDSNESAVMSEPQIVTTEPDDSAHSGHQQNYFDSKLFAVAGASFNFSMAAALAADSLAGLNNQGHNVGGGTDGLAGTSQGKIHSLSPT
ncbi:hypothetical protein J6590_051474 [Homalodisca vitripennis]|nr:hypothetical protein J6590_051474 [Homalodisca vitripennis]